ncbi:MAG: MraY family glycosyltransferase [Actinomycetota bacterium]|nr:MraY family glycosyltransferase [Actinomycetota bacterium]
MAKYFVAFGVALAGTLLLTPLARRLALRLNAIDVPEYRKVHVKDTPTMGGVAIYVSILLGTAVYLLITGHRMSTDLMGILIGATVIFIFGAVDDIRTLGPLTKLFGQIFAAGILVIMGVQIQNIHVPGMALISLSPELSVLISLIWVVAFINIINLIDGLDGLAAGITCIASFSMFYYATQTGAGRTYVDAALISIVLAGSTLGFLRYNFHPASIFMGDSGSMLLGFMLGAVTIQGVLKSIAAIALFVPIVALAIPIIDTGMAIVRRGIRGTPITHADKEHIHHRLLDMGHSQRQAVLLIYFWTALLCVLILAIKFSSSNRVIWLMLALTIGGFTLTALPRIARRGRLKGKHRAGRNRDAGLRDENSNAKEKT